MPPISPPTGYLRDILDQPKAVRDTLQGLREQSLEAAVASRLAHGAYRRIVLTGMGSSYTAFHPLQQALVARGLEVYRVETSELLYSLPGLLRADTLVVAASQSGRSAEIVSLLKRREGSFSILGVTNTLMSPLGEGADALVLTRAGEEATVSCKTYLAALLALAWLEPVLLGDPPEPLLADLERAAPVVESYLAAWQEHVADLKERLKSTRDLFIVGRGASLAAAETGGLIVKESTHLHGEGMSSAAFRHGPLEMVGPETFVLILEGSGPVSELNRGLYQYIRAAGGPAGLVSAAAPEPVFRLPAVPESARPLVEILPVQMMTLALAALHGHEPGHFTLGRKITTTE